ncbi:family 78 glycoside hydrolase catalytic domain [Niallia alba]|uniref:family 78 glycoside hydrolase catalytic domain n=1 Tax=Niallia alba TaxID=2729105 RepID=UPI002E24BFA0|nr:family 78 glycoside hydrolase catalytic domain [Niallia alba]
MLKINEIRIEDLTKNIVTDNEKPTFSFKVESDGKGITILQTQIKVFMQEILVWDSGISEDGETLNIQYAGQPLLPFTTYRVQIWVKDSSDETAEEQAIFETGRFEESWRADWITDLGYHFFFSSPKPMVFRKKFEISKSVKNIKVYSTAFGVYSLEFNGDRVEEDYFSPGYTSYQKQMQYQTFDITNMVKKENTLIATVAGGWAVGDYSMMHTKKIYSNRQALMIEIRITYMDGRMEVIGTDSSWEVSTKGNWRYADFYNGEIYDAQIDIDKISYKRADVMKPRLNPKLMANYGSPVRKQEKLIPLNKWKSKTGALIYDFGQNFAGIISAKINGIAGQKITFKHAEICMDDDLYTKPLRWAKARIIYTCKEGSQEYIPRFTYMGFRYVKVEGISDMNLELSAYALYSDVEKTGDFQCSNEALNRLQKNISWSGKSNFVDIPTDCPQRDERMGWTGDIAVFASTACYNFRMKRFLDKWLLDVIAEQGENGGIPDIVPPGKYGKPKTTACWADACVLVPWASYLAYGDKELLKRQYNSMKKHIKAALALAEKGSEENSLERYIWRAGFHYGDWCAPGETKKQWKEKAPWVATAFLANSCRIMSNISRELEYEEDSHYYEELANAISQAYIQIHTDDDGRLYQEFQTGYVLPLYFGLGSKETLSKMAEHLAMLVKKADYHLETGFCGTPYLLFALSDYGYLDIAYKLLLQDTCPSWLYEIKAGATTVWERWDALKPDGTVNQSNNMVSFNHYAYGAVGDWLYRRIAGIEMIEPAYRNFKIQPMPGGGLTWAKASIETSYGEIISSWKIEDEFYIEVVVPVNTSCQLILPDGSKRKLGSGKYNFCCAFNNLDWRYNDEIRL